MNYNYYNYVFKILKSDYTFQYGVNFKITTKTPVHLEFKYNFNFFIVFLKFSSLGNIIYESSLFSAQEYHGSNFERNYFEHSWVK